MMERDWNKELEKVDKHLASLSDEELVAPKPASGTAVAAPAKSSAAPARGESAQAAEPRRTTGFGVYTRLTLSVLLGIAMLVWPYQARCGVGLAGYLAAVIVVVASGVWSSIWTWRHRAARAHTLSLLIILWGLVLGSMEVLPRVGYALPSFAHPAAWACR
jgi:hypothetical protein